jgi:hypothetical protein
MSTVEIKPVGCSAVASAAPLGGSIDDDDEPQPFVTALSADAAVQARGLPPPQPVSGMSTDAVAIDIPDSPRGPPRVHALSADASAQPLGARRPLDALSGSVTVAAAAALPSPRPHARAVSGLGGSVAITPQYQPINGLGGDADAGPAAAAPGDVRIDLVPDDDLVNELMGPNVRGLCSKGSSASHRAMEFGSSRKSNENRTKFTRAYKQVCASVLGQLYTGDGARPRPAAGVQVNVRINLRTLEVLVMEGDQPVPQHIVAARVKILTKAKDGVEATPGIKELRDIMATEGVSYTTGYPTVCNGSIGNEQGVDPFEKTSDRLKKLQVTTFVDFAAKYLEAILKKRFPQNAGESEADYNERLDAQRASLQERLDRAQEVFRAKNSALTDQIQELEEQREALAADQTEERKQLQADIDILQRLQNELYEHVYEVGMALCYADPIDEGDPRFNQADVNIRERQLREARIERAQTCLDQLRGHLEDAESNRFLKMISGGAWGSGKLESPEHDHAFNVALMTLPTLADKIAFYQHCKYDVLKYKASFAEHALVQDVERGGFGDGIDFGSHLNGLSAATRRALLDRIDPPPPYRV